MRVKVTVKLGSEIMEDIIDFNDGESLEDVDRIISEDIVPRWVEWNWEQVEEE